MSLVRSKTFAVMAASLGLAALLGGSLGLATAGVRNMTLEQGFNLVGGPLSADTAPGDFLSCLPQTSWNAVYIWDGDDQRWLHHFNTAKGVPEYVNDTDVGGISIIRRFTGVVLLMDETVNSPNLADSPGEACD